MDQAYERILREIKTQISPAALIRFKHDVKEEASLEKRIEAGATRLWVHFFTQATQKKGTPRYDSMKEAQRQGTLELVLASLHVVELELALHASPVIYDYWRSVVAATQLPIADVERYGQSLCQSIHAQVPDLLIALHTFYQVYPAASAKTHMQ